MHYTTLKICNNRFLFPNVLFIIFNLRLQCKVYIFLLHCGIQSCMMAEPCWSESTYYICIASVKKRVKKTSWWARKVKNYHACPQNFSEGMMLWFKHCIHHSAFCMVLCIYKTFWHIFWGWTYFNLRHTFRMQNVRFDQKGSKWWRSPQLLS